MICYKLLIYTISALGLASLAAPDSVPDRNPALGTDTGTDTNDLLIYTVSAPGTADPDPDQKPALVIGTGTWTNNNELLIYTSYAFGLASLAAPDSVPDRNPALGTDTNDLQVYNVSAPGPADLDQKPALVTGTKGPFYNFTICFVSGFSTDDSLICGAADPDAITSSGSDSVCYKTFLSYIVTTYERYNILLGIIADPGATPNGSDTEIHNNFFYVLFQDLALMIP
jgi:hypothetical protein